MGNASANAIVEIICSGHPLQLRIWEKWPRVEWVLLANVVFSSTFLTLTLLLCIVNKDLRSFLCLVGTWLFWLSASTALLFLRLFVGAYHFVRIIIDLLLFLFMKLASKAIMAFQCAKNNFQADPKERLLAEMEEADSLLEWQQSAAALDVLTRAAAWREIEESNLYEWKAVKAHLEKLKAARINRNIPSLMFLLRLCAARDFCGISNPRLFAEAHTGTKRLVEEFTEEFCTSLRVVCYGTEHPEHSKTAMSAASTGDGEINNTRSATTAVERGSQHDQTGNTNAAAFAYPITTPSEGSPTPQQHGGKVGHHTYSKATASIGTPRATSGCLLSDSTTQTVGYEVREYNPLFSPNSISHGAKGAEGAVSVSPQAWDLCSNTAVPERDRTQGHSANSLSQQSAISPLSALNLKWNLFHQSTMSLSTTESVALKMTVGDMSSELPHSVGMPKLKDQINLEGPFTPINSAVLSSTNPRTPGSVKPNWIKRFPTFFPQKASPLEDLSADLEQPHPAPSMSSTSLGIATNSDGISSRCSSSSSTNCLSPSKDNLIRFLATLRLSVGRTALCLSGGGSLAMYHMGLARALIQIKCLPRVISGTSGGSIVAGVLAIHNDDVLMEEYLRPDIVTRYGRRWFPPMSRQLRRFFLRGQMMEGEEFQKTCQAYYGKMTFKEAFLRTGRLVSIVVTPASRAHGEALILNCINSPDVLIWSAVAASCALPGLLPPHELVAKGPDCNPVPYYPSGLKWIDGSISQDLPVRELSSLFNVKQFIVSQVNPHHAPFVESHRRGSWMMHLMENWLILDIKHRYGKLAKFNMVPKIFGQDISSFWMVQDFEGHVTVTPQASLIDWYRMINQPTIEDMHDYLCKGQARTWPHCSRISHMLKVEQALRRCWADLTQSLKYSPHPQQLPSQMLNQLQSPRIPSGIISSFNPDGGSSGLHQQRGNSSATLCCTCNCLKIPTAKQNQNVRPQLRQHPQQYAEEKDGNFTSFAYVPATPVVASSRVVQDDAEKGDYGTVESEYKKLNRPKGLRFRKKKQRISFGLKFCTVSMGIVK